MITHTELTEMLSYAPETGLFTWRVKSSKKTVVGSVAGTVNGGGYVQIRLRGRIYAAHRLAIYYTTGTWPALHIDHINGIKIDNRVTNLRLATRSQNQFNRRTPADERGIRRRGDSFQARIHANGREVTLGTFRTLADARAARKISAVETYGDFAAFAQHGN